MSCRPAETDEFEAAIDDGLRKHSCGEVDSLIKY